MGVLPGQLERPAVGAASCLRAAARHRCLGLRLGSRPLGAQVSAGVRILGQTGERGIEQLSRIASSLFSTPLFPLFLAGRIVEVLSDNVTSVAHINKFGSSNVRLDGVAQDIWAFALRNDISLVAHHVAGVANAGPDALSRMSARHEWVLHPSIFRQLGRMFGPHTVDRFASVSTALLPCYNSRYADPLSVGVDALGQADWAGENNWVNPPFRLVPKVLDVIEAQRADATLIAPMWPGQPWMARLRRLCTAPPLRLPPVARACLPLAEHQQIEPHRNLRWTPGESLARSARRTWLVQGREQLSEPESGK